jgi:signal transduction histidine kinase/DNA-binding response OmpR family regulator
VVDDDATIRALAERGLGHAGFEVITRASGAGLLEDFAALRPDAVLLDIILPDSDGYTLCRALRALPDAKYVPIVMLTSQSDEDAIRLAFDAGATEFVSKPVTWVHEGYRFRYLLRAAGTMRELDAARITLARAAQEWKDTFDAVDDPVVMVGPDLIIRRANRAAARMGNAPDRDLVGKHCHEVFSLNKACREDCPIKRAFATGRSVRTELRGYGPGKSDCLVSAAPVFSSGGTSPDAAIYLIKDVTEFRQLETGLLQAQKMEALGTLAAGVAHDFNNLLQGIAGWAEFLSASTTTPPQLAEGLSQITTAASRGRSLAQQLLMTSRKTTGGMTPTAIGPVVKELAALLARSLPKSIKIETIVSGDAARIYGDADRLHQAIMNLGVNASHAMPNGGLLRIEVRNTMLDEAYCAMHPNARIGPHVMIGVSDTGTGIDPSVLPRIFEPFFTTKPAGTGTGLGLAVVYAVTRDHGGHVTCYSERGHGTTFRLYVPALPADTTPVAELPAPSAQVQPASGTGKTILMADDEPMILCLVTRLLEEHKYSVVRVSDGQEALNYFLSHRDAPLDAIILDMSMPQMDGETCMRALSANGCKAPILLATGSLFPRDREDELLGIASGILSKPFQLTELLAALAKLFDKNMT